MKKEEFIKIQLDEFRLANDEEKENIKKEQLHCLQHFQNTILSKANITNINISSKEIKEIAIEQMLIGYQSLVDIVNEMKEEK